MRLIWRFFRFAIPHRRQAMIGLGLMLLGVILQIPRPFLTMYIVDGIIPTRNLTSLHRMAALLLVLVLLAAWINQLQNRALMIFRERMVYDLRMTLFTHVCSLPLAWFASKQSGYVTARLNGDAKQLRGLMANDVFNATREILMLIAGIGIAFALNRRLATVAAVVLPFYTLWLAYWNPRVRRATHQMQDNYAQVSGTTLETVTGILTIKALVAEGRAALRLAKRLRQGLASEFETTMSLAWMTTGAAVLSGAGRTAILWLGAVEIMQGRLTIGAFLAFNTFLGYLFEPVRTLVTINSQVQSALVSMERLFELLDEPPEERRRDARGELEVPRGDVVVEDLTFSYDGRKNVLESVNLRIAGGSTVAIVGRSGCGKTTLLNLLMGFYAPSSGRISIDDQDTAAVSLRSLRTQLSLVPQKPTLLSGTIEDNFHFSVDGASPQAMIRSCQMADAHGLISSLPGGFETEVGEGGVRLSVGQAQRLSLAMALVRDTKILLLDEATSAVDLMVESRIFKALRKHAADRTVILVTHRLHTLRHVDQIFVIEDGKLVEQGRHADLLRRCGVYAALYQELLQEEDEKVHVARAKAYVAEAAQ
jgi:ABC-type bacteriocin/lantibiotic exporter with double-glycine peptidase domain